MANCATCGCDYNIAERRGKPGRIIDCEACYEEAGDVQPYTGVIIYGHKAGATLQINADPALTEYIKASTALRNKGSNLGNNLKVSASRKTKGEGGCIVPADVPDYKGRRE